MNAKDRDAFSAFFEVPPVLVQGYIADLFVPGAFRSVLRERDRAPLEAVPPGDGYRVVVEFFVETAGRARLLTASLDMRRPPDGDDASWRIVSAEGLTSIHGIYRLRLQTKVQFTARNFEIIAEDFTLSLVDGTVFLVECDDGVTGLVLLGRGELRFAPLRIRKGTAAAVLGSESLVTPFDDAFIRLSPEDYATREDLGAFWYARRMHAWFDGPRKCSTSRRRSPSSSTSRNSARTTGISCLGLKTS